MVLPGEVDEELNHTVGPTDYHRDDAWRASVIKHYQANLQRMIDIAKRSLAKIVFITPPPMNATAHHLRVNYRTTIPRTNRSWRRCSGQVIERWTNVTGRRSAKLPSSDHTG